MNDNKLSILKKVLSTTLIMILLGSSFVFCDEKPVSKNTKLMPSGEVVELGVKLKYPIVTSKLNRNKALKESDILLSIKLNGEEITPSRKNIEKTMKVENLPLKATCYRNGKVKSMDITSDDLRDFEFGYYSFYLGTVTAIDSNGNFIGLSHNLKDEQMPFDFLDNAIYNQIDYKKRKDKQVAPFSIINAFLVFLHNSSPLHTSYRTGENPMLQDPLHVPYTNFQMSHGHYFFNSILQDVFANKILRTIYIIPAI